MASRARPENWTAGQCRTSCPYTPRSCAANRRSAPRSTPPRRRWWPPTCQAWGSVPSWEPLTSPGARLADGGVPVYPRGVLIRTRLLAAEMADAMGTGPVVLLRGHGLTSSGSSVAEAVLRAVSVDQLARLALTIAAAGGQLRDLPEEDRTELPDLGTGFNLGTA